MDIFPYSPLPHLRMVGGSIIPSETQPKEGVSDRIDCLSTSLPPASLLLLGHGQQFLQYVVLA